MSLKVGLVQEMNEVDVLDKLGYKIMPKPFGKGCFSEVYGCVKGGKEYAFKKIKPEQWLFKKWFATDNKDGDLLRGEGLALALPKHQNILSAYALIVYDQDNMLYRYEGNLDFVKKGNNEKIVGVLTEYVERSLDLSSLLQQRVFNKEEVQKIGIQIADAIASIHAKNFSHRDIKPSNVLVDFEYKVKVIDFTFLRNLNTVKRQRANSSCGTSYYAAPEIFKIGAKDNGLKVDLWSFGITLYKIAFRYFPSFYDNDKNLYVKKLENFLSKKVLIEDLDGQRAEIQNNDISKDKCFWDLLNKLICVEEKRFNIQQVLLHPFFQ